MCLLQLQETVRDLAQHLSTGTLNVAAQVQMGLQRCTELEHQLATAQATEVSLTVKVVALHNELETIQADKDHLQHVASDRFVETVTGASLITTAEQTQAELTTLNELDVISSVKNDKITPGKPSADTGSFRGGVDSVQGQLTLDRQESVSFALPEQVAESKAKVAVLEATVVKLEAERAKYKIAMHGLASTLEATLEAVHSFCWMIVLIHCHISWHYLTHCPAGYCSRHPCLVLSRPQPRFH